LCSNSAEYRCLRKEDELNVLLATDDAAYDEEDEGAYEDEGYEENGEEIPAASNNHNSETYLPAKVNLVGQTAPDEQEEAEEEAEEEEEYYEEDDQPEYEQERSQSAYSQHSQYSQYSEQSPSRSGSITSAQQPYQRASISTPDRGQDTPTQRIQSILARANQGQYNSPVTVGASSMDSQTPTSQLFNGNNNVVMSPARTPSVQFSEPIRTPLSGPGLSATTGTQSPVAPGSSGSAHRSSLSGITVNPIEPQTEEEAVSTPKRKGQGDVAPTSSPRNSKQSAQGTPSSPKPAGSTPKKLTPAKASSASSLFSIMHMESRVAIDQAVEKGCLDLFGLELSQIDLPAFLPTQSLRGIRTLILRSNNITDMESARLMHLTPALTELDLGNNRLSGALPHNALPLTLLRLDLSQNNLTDVSEAVIGCVQLQSLSLRSNLIKNITGLPPALLELDLSDNLLTSFATLRAVASFSHNIHTLGVAGNPIFDSTDGLRPRLTSMLPQLRFLDGEALPGSRVRKHPASAAGGSGQNSNTSVNASSMLDVSSATDKRLVMTKKQQQAADARRFKEHQLQLQRLEAAQRPAAQPKIRPDEVKNLLTRLLRPKEVPKYKPLVDQYQAPAKKKLHHKHSKTPAADAVLESMAQTRAEAKDGSEQEPVESNEIKNALRTLEPWSAKSAGEIGAAVLLLDEAFFIASGASLDAVAVRRFITSQRRISFVADRLRLSPEVEAAVNLVQERGSLERRESLSQLLSRMRSLGSVLTDIGSAMEFCLGYSLTMADLRTSVEVTMCKPDGIFVIEQVLPEFGIEFKSLNVPDVSESEKASASANHPELETGGSHLSGGNNSDASTANLSAASSSVNKKLSYAEMDECMDNLKSRLTARAKLMSKGKSGRSLSPEKTNKATDSETSSAASVDSAPVVHKAAPRLSSNPGSYEAVGQDTKEVLREDNAVQPQFVPIVEVKPIKPASPQHALKKIESETQHAASAAPPAPSSVKSLSVAERLAQRLANRSTSGQSNQSGNSSLSTTPIPDESNDSAAALQEDSQQALGASEGTEYDYGTENSDARVAMRDRLMARMKK
jgi:hypothetical protein